MDNSRLQRACQKTRNFPEKKSDTCYASAHQVQIMSITGKQTALQKFIYTLHQSPE